jgi:hypothetical protein
LGGSKIKEGLCRASLPDFPLSVLYANIHILLITYVNMCPM